MYKEVDGWAILTDVKNIALLTDPIKAKDLQSGLAKLIRRGGGEPTLTEWQALDGLLILLNEAFAKDSGIGRLT